MKKLSLLIGLLILPISIATGVVRSNYDANSSIAKVGESPASVRGRLTFIAKVEESPASVKEQYRNS